jgi:FAD/FMN-containing dehydrogenase
MATIVQPGLLLSENVEISNFSENVPKVKAKRVYDVRNGSTQSDYAQGVLNLQRVVTDAEADGKRVRAMGTAWSFSPCAVTDDYLVNVLSLARLLPGWSTTELEDPSERGTVVNVQAGARVGAVNDYLMSKGKSLRTMGGRSGQTIGGAALTGSHGAQIDQRPIPDQVRGVHLIGKGGESLWIEAESRPLVKETWAQQHGMKLVRDDDLLHAVVVSVGCIGIVHSLAVEIVDGFNLDFHRVRRKLDPELRALMRSLDFGAGYVLPGGTGRPYHFEVVINPYAVDASDGVSLTVCWEAPFAVPPPPPGGASLQPGAAVGDLLSALAGIAPGAVPTTLQLLLNQQYPPKTVNAPYAIVFPRNVPVGFKPMAAEIALPVSQAEKALDAILDEIDASRAQHNFAYPGLVSFRYGKATRALIGFSQFEPTCTIEFPCMAGVDGTGDFFLRVFSRLDQASVDYRRHWGQVNFLTPGRTASDYGAKLATWKAKRVGLLGASAKTFANAYSDAVGLTL